MLSFISMKSYYVPGTRIGNREGSALNIIPDLKSAQLIDKDKFINRAIIRHHSSSWNRHINKVL